MGDVGEYFGDDGDSWAGAKGTTSVHRSSAHVIVDLQAVEQKITKRHKSEDQTKN